ncbi:hypothetical protein BDP27DRAFT_1372053 [Rhodocollybia butyracea]|uniref:Uncharacterized protein n=1 Tax=Rhodocollybia butyracea TaxID=206335 RepID=A0A9P5TWZ2_9AGAR|nr:hypothetical protein BDP27DRAFT_1372053 [Rhodocollybia butyracea]
MALAVGVKDTMYTKEQPPHSSLQLLYAPRLTIHMIKDELKEDHRAAPVLLQVPVFQRRSSINLDTVGFYARSTLGLQLMADAFRLSDEDPEPFTVWPEAGPGTVQAREKATERQGQSLDDFLVGQVEDVSKMTRRDQFMNLLDNIASLRPKIDTIAGSCADQVVQPEVLAAALYPKLAR